MTSLSRLRNTIPRWVSLENDNGMSIGIRAQAPKPSGELGRTYYLVIKLVGGDKIEVYEDQVNRTLPECCLERHINGDGSFCLHRDSTNPLQNDAEARVWWSSLADYLNHQEYASKHRKWPISAQLSHGDGAIVQLRMEELADSVGWKEELLSSIFRKKGWLAGALPRRSKDGDQLVNVRTPCPRGCVNLHYPHRAQACRRTGCAMDCGKHHAAILRAKCPHRSVVEQLVLLEYKRRFEENKVIDALRSKGTSCCGTMDNCPLSCGLDEM